MHWRIPQLVFRDAQPGQVEVLLLPLIQEVAIWTVL
jgi:cell division inhibitor SulA